MHDNPFADDTPAAEPLVIPFEQLSNDALNGVLEEYISREGTDYGLIEKDLDAQLAVARKQLTKGRVLIIFDPVTERCQIIESELLQQWQAAKTSND